MSYSVIVQFFIASNVYLDMLQKYIFPQVEQIELKNIISVNLQKDPLITA